MKVRVEIIIEVDPEAYRATYGESQSIAEIRDDVKWSAFNAVAQTTFPFEEQETIVKRCELLNA
jgi:hypothetical protein